MESFDNKSNIVHLRQSDKVFEGNVEDYDATYTLVKKVLKVLGLRMTINDTKLVGLWWNAYFWFAFTNVFVAVSLETISMLQTAAGGNFLGLFTMMPCVGYLVVALAKASKIKIYRSVFENLVYELRDMWPNGRIPEDEHQILNESLTKLKFLVRAYFSCNMALGSIFIIPILVIYIKHLAGYDVQLQLPFFYWLPFDPYQDIKYLFETMFVIQTTHCFLSALFMMAGDLLLCIFLSHITTQFALLVVRINKLFYIPIDDQLIEAYPLGVNSKLRDKENHDVGVEEENSETRIQAELVLIIQRHRALIGLSGDIENMYTFSLLVNFMNSSVIICFCLFCVALGLFSNNIAGGARHIFLIKSVAMHIYMLLMPPLWMNIDISEDFVEKWNEIIYKIFLFTAVSQTFILCWYGQRLLDTSTGVAEALYNSGWYAASHKLKKSILIMINRSQKPVQITTYGFSVISLESYATILKTSWSYFTLLINMYNED